MDTPTNIAGSIPAPRTIMYKLSNITHPTYGQVVFIERSEEGTIANPFDAWQQALKNQRVWQEKSDTIVRWLVIDQLLTPSQLEQWYHHEYAKLPKCSACAQILGEIVHTHQLCGDSLFCAKSCADKDYFEEIEKLKDEEEADFR